MMVDFGSEPMDTGSHMSMFDRFFPLFCRFRIRKDQTSYPEQSAVPTAALAECTCPEYCERDHDNE